MMHEGYIEIMTTLLIFGWTFPVMSEFCLQIQRITQFFKDKCLQFSFSQCTLHDAVCRVFLCWQQHFFWNILSPCLTSIQEDWHYHLVRQLTLYITLTSCDVMEGPNSGLVFIQKPNAGAKTPQNLKCMLLMHAAPFPCCLIWIWVCKCGYIIMRLAPINTNVALHKTTSTTPPERSSTSPCWLPHDTKRS